MKITLYVNTSDEKVIDKHLVEKATLENVVWKENTSILTPTFTFRKFDTDDGNIWKNFNYVRLKWADMQDRYYFVKDMILEKGGIINIVCEEDVRYTWRKEIRAQQFLIARQEFINNKVIHDDRCVMPLTRQIDTVKIGDVGDEEGDGSIILTVSGRKFNVH